MKFDFTCADGSAADTIPEIPKGSYALALDGSTARSGICVMSYDGVLGFLCAAIREKETIVEYKLKLKKMLTDIIQIYGIHYTAYEEPFIGYMGDVKGLYTIASTLEEIAVEMQPYELTVFGVNNKRWKKHFLGKVMGDSALQKKNVYEKVLQRLPQLARCKNDETDAYGLADFLVASLKSNTLDAMASQGKAHKFKYDIEMRGGRLTSEEAAEIAGKPRKDGVIIADISGKKTFDSAVFSLMRGKDAILLLYFKSGKFGDIILEHKAGEIAAKNDIISAVVTRATKRK